MCRVIVCLGEYDTLLKMHQQLYKFESDKELCGCRIGLLATEGGGTLYITTALK